MSQLKARGSRSRRAGPVVRSPHIPMSLPPPLPPPAAARDPVTPEGRLGLVTPELWASGAPLQAQPPLRREAQEEEEEEEGEETGVQGAWGTGTAEQRRRGWGETAEAAAAEKGQVEAVGTAAAAAAAGSVSPARGAGDGRGGWWWLLAWLRRRQPQCCPCVAPLPRSAAHCCHGGTKMAALAYNLGKREINHYFSVRSAKVLALVAVLLLAVCHLASRRYRGERALPLPRRGRRRRGCCRRPHSPDTRPRSRGCPPACSASWEGVAPTCPPRRAWYSRPTKWTPAQAAMGSATVVLGPRHPPTLGPGGAHPGLAGGAAGVRALARAGPGEAVLARGLCAGGEQAALESQPRAHQAKVALQGVTCAPGVGFFSLCCTRPLPWNSRAKLLDSGRGRPIFPCR